MRRPVALLRDFSVLESMTPAASHPPVFAYGPFRSMIRLCCVLLLVVIVTPVHAIEFVAVGVGDGALPWDQAGSSSRFVSVEADSIWMWDIATEADLTRGLAERGGFALYAGETGLDTLRTTALFDGDPTTYFDPDENAAIARSSSILVDLGGTFNINRVRFFPRLDVSHRNRFLQEFSLRAALILPIGDVDLVLERGLAQFQAPNENTEPVVDLRFGSVSARFLQLQPLTGRAWEIAELEVYSDGTVPQGEYVSVPLPARQATPVWGEVSYEGGNLAQAPFVVQTRTGPDPHPLLHFIKNGDELVQIDAASWATTLPGLQGPVEPNPEWGGWSTVTDGAVRSPALNRYLQFRVSLPVPGTGLRELRFEYSFPPIARDLAAEVWPRTVAAGVETDFTLSLAAEMKTSGAVQRRDTGFRQIEVRTSAEISRVGRVLVDDEEVFATAQIQPGVGFSLNLWERVLRDGSFVQIELTAAALRDRTLFEVRAVDRRSDVDDGQSVAYQLARAADVDVSTPGGGLIVDLDDGGDGGTELLANVRLHSPVITPNGDGANDALQVSLSLLKLIEPARLRLEIFGLDGELVRRAVDTPRSSSNLILSWDGRDDAGQVVPPGSYLYQIRVDADASNGRHHGIVSVAY
jgi:hypothetical protein